MSRKHAAEPVTPRAEDAGESAKKRRSREEWERRDAEDRRLRDSNAFKIWTICPHKICRRNKGCGGDTEECVTQRWRRVVPDELRIYMFKVAHLVSEQGMSVEQACNAAEADFKQRAEIAARYEAQAATRSKSP